MFDYPSVSRQDSPGTHLTTPLRRSPMRKAFGFLTVVLLAGATTAFAAKPIVIEECPTDVGAALATACPCDGPGQAWKNHGKYVSCVAHYRNALRKAGCLDAEAKRTIQSCAARSTCGKEGA